MPIVIRPARSDGDFAALFALRTRMQDWDIAMSAAAGKRAQDVQTAHCSADTKALRHTFTGACMLLAWDAGQPIGTLGYSRFQDHTAEIQHFYVAEEARGKGAGRARLMQVLTRLTAEGYGHACLETATFMTPAFALNSTMGFQTCPPFRPPPPGPDGFSVFMNRACGTVDAAHLFGG